MHNFFQSFSSEARYIYKEPLYSMLQLLYNNLPFLERESFQIVLGNITLSFKYEFWHIDVFSLVSLAQLRVLKALYFI